MVQFKNFEAAVTVDGKDLEEYAPAESEAQDEDRTINRYVEVVSGAKFALRLKALNGDCAEDGIAGIQISAEVDGLGGSGSSWLASKYPFPFTIEGRHSRRAGKGYIQAFQFSQLQIGDQEVDASADTQKLVEKAAAIGIIKLSVYRASSIKESTDKGNYGELAGAVEHGYNEKLFKGRAVSHQTSYEAPQELKREHSNAVLIDALDRPYRHFIFHYASKPSLQLLGLIPRPPIPVPLSERNEDELTREELLELVKTQKADRQTGKALKQEMKRERSMTDDEDISVVETRRVRPRLATGEVVDLTDD